MLSLALLFVVNMLMFVFVCSTRGVVEKEVAVGAITIIAIIITKSGSSSIVFFCRAIMMDDVGAIRYSS